MSSEPIGIAIVGCGWAAGEIARAAGGLPSVRIVTVFDTDTARAAELAARTGAGHARDLDAAIGDPAVKLVYVGVPHALIAPIVERALAAGRHVLAEKPLALDPAEARRLGQMAERAGLTLSVFFELRRAGTVTAAKRIIGDGDIGEPRLVRLRTIIDKNQAYWGPPEARSWRAVRGLAGGGVLLMNTIHQLDTLRYITGLEVVSARGEIATLSAGVEVEDTVSATLRLANGALVSVVAAAHSPGANHDETIEIDGSEGRLDLPDPFGIAPLRLYRRSSGVWSDIAVERPDSHRLMLHAVLDAVRGGGAVPAGAEDAARAVATVNAVYRSAREGRAVEIG